LFPLVGVGNTPASPSNLFYGFSLNSDDNEFEVIESPTSSAGFDRINDNIDNDEKASTIIESQETNDNHAPQLRQNAVPSSFSTFKTAILQGISVE
jgi:hypothetical protein